MLRFAANLSMLYTEHDFLDRFAAAARDGFKAVEYLFPYDHEPALLAGRLADHGLQQVLFNAQPGDWNAGERGLSSLPGRETEFREGFLRALDYAQALNCPRIHVMAGLVQPNAEPGLQRRLYLENLAWAAEAAAPRRVDVLIEPINTRDIPGYLLNRQADAHAIVAEVGASNLKVQMDLYHLQIVEGDVTMSLRRYLPTGKVGHLQIAGVPMRQEPDLGELKLDHLLGVIEELGYDGWIGCEYRPRAGTSQGLDWFRRTAR